MILVNRIAAGAQSARSAAATVEPVSSSCRLTSSWTFSRSDPDGASTSTMPVFTRAGSRSSTYATPEELTPGCAVRGHVDGDHVLLGGESRRPVRPHDDAPAGEPLRQVVVG